MRVCVCGLLFEGALFSLVSRLASRKSKDNHHFLGSPCFAKAKCQAEKGISKMRFLKLGQPDRTHVCSCACCLKSFRQNCGDSEHANKNHVHTA